MKKSFSSATLTAATGNQRYFYGTQNQTSYFREKKNYGTWARTDFRIYRYMYRYRGTGMHELVLFMGSVAEPVDQLIGSGSDLPNRLRFHAKRTGSGSLVTSREKSIL